MGRDGIVSNEINDIASLACGKRYYLDPDYLSDAQTRALAAILAAVREKSQGLAQSATKPGERGPENRLRSQRQVYLIDGPRGIGKTYTLTTARMLLEKYGAKGDLSIQTIVARLRQEVPERLDSIGSQDGERALLGSWFEELSKPDGESSSEFEFEGAALTIPPIFPADMVGEETPLTHLLTNLVSALESRKRPKDLTGRNDELKTLIERCRKLSAGWLFARNIGVESILYNTPSVQEFMDEYGRQSAEAASRLSSWRRLVHDVLNALGRNVLVVFLDEADSEQAIQSGIFQLLRSYLDHDRIITVAAGNMRALRNHMAISFHEEIAKSAKSGLSQASLRELRDSSRLEVEERLHKIFPHWQHFFLTPNNDRRNDESTTSRPTLDDLTSPKVGTVTTDHFNVMALRVLNNMRPQFVRAKVVAYKHGTKFQNRRHEAVWSSERMVLDEFISWWLFRRSYLRALRPKTPRHIISFFANNQSKLSSEHWQGDTGRRLTKPRLAVQFFQQASNINLAHQFTDWDENVLEWLKRQRLSSDWRGKRQFTINERTYYEGEYAYSYLSFRIDLGLALPLKVNEQESVPVKLLPSFAGYEHWGPISIEMNKVEAQQFGLARSIQHHGFPKNCIHMVDMATLPEAAFESSEHAETNLLFEGRLYDDWPRSFSHHGAERGGWAVQGLFRALSGLKRETAVAYANEQRLLPIAEVYERLQDLQDAVDFPEDVVGLSGTLLNDLRKAWLAMVAFSAAIRRTFEPDQADVPETAAQEFSAALEDAAGISHEDYRSGLFRLPDYETMMKVCNGHEEIDAWLRDGPEKHLAHFWGQEDVLKLIELLRVRPDSSDSDNSQGKGHKDHWSNLAFSAGSDSEADGKPSFDERRLFRPLLLFVHAILPCLPSLALYSALTAHEAKAQNGIKDSPADRVKKWIDFHSRCVAFAAFARGELLLGRKRMIEMSEAKTGETAAEPKNISIMYIPDFSWFSLFGDEPKFANHFGFEIKEGLICSIGKSADGSRRALDCLIEHLEPNTDG